MIKSYFDETDEIQLQNTLKERFITPVKLATLCIQNHHMTYNLFYENVLMKIFN